MDPFVPLVVELEIPDVGESGNSVVWAKGSQFVYRRLKDRLRKALLTCRPQKIPTFRRPVALTWRPMLGPGRRKFDCGNYWLTAKIVEDLLVECHVLRGDSTDFVVRQTIEAPIRAENGRERMVLTIEEQDLPEIPEELELAL